MAEQQLFYFKGVKPTKAAEAPEGPDDVERGSVWSQRETEAGFRGSSLLSDPPSVTVETRRSSASLEPTTVLLKGTMNFTRTHLKVYGLM